MEKRIITVRKIDSVEDAAVLAKMNVTMALETEKRHLDADLVLAATKTLINSPKMGTYFIAETVNGDGEII